MASPCAIGPTGVCGVPDFALCFEAHREDGQVWAIKSPIGNIEDDQDWTFAAKVFVDVPTRTAYRGVEAVNPKAYVWGECDSILRQYDMVHDHTIARMV